VTICASLRLLQETAAALDHLRSQFESSGDIVDDEGRAIGAHQLHDALHDFATNWKVHRRGITDSIEAVSKMAHPGHDGYVDVDDQLARGITTDSSGGPPAAGGPR
jgi:uncharacterized membrane-anchored protein